MDETITKLNQKSPILKRLGVYRTNSQEYTLTRCIPMVVKSFFIDNTQIIIHDDFILKDKSEIEYKQKELNSIAVKIANKIDNKKA